MSRATNAIMARMDMRCAARPAPSGRTTTCPSRIRTAPRCEGSVLTPATQALLFLPRVLRKRRPFRKERSGFRPFRQQSLPNAAELRRGRHRRMSGARPRTPGRETAQRSPAPIHARSRPRVRPAQPLLIQEAPELPAPRRVFQLAQRLRLDLADAFARDGELLAHFLQRVVGVHADPEAHPEHTLLARR